MVTLHVQIMQVFGPISISLQILTLVAFPGKDAEVFGIKDKTAETSEIKLCLRLDAETAAHVVVALNNIKVVTFSTT